MSLSKSSFFLMAGIGMKESKEFSFTESLHMQLREDKYVWVSPNPFGVDTELFPLFCKKSETAFDDAFVLSAAWAKSMMKKDDSFLKYIQDEFKNHPRKRRNPFTKEIYFQAKEILLELTPPLNFIAVSLDGIENAGNAFLRKAKEYKINFELCCPYAKNTKEPYAF